MADKTERTWVFTWLDLVAPWGVCLLSAALCLWAALKGTPMGNDNPLVPKMISIAVGLFFLAGIPLWYFVRSRFRRFTYKTKHDIYVVQGKVNKPSQTDVERWTDSVIEHWADREFTTKDGKTYRLSAEKVLSALDGLMVFYVDKEKLSVFGRFVRGYSWGKDIVVGWRADKIEQQGTTDWKYVESLTRHEESHPVLGNNGVGWDEATHHAIFKSTSLGA